MKATRRAVLAGLGILATPAFALGGRNDLRAALDAAEKDGDPAHLASFDARALPPGQRLDLLTARAGLAIDAKLATATGAERYTLLLQQRSGTNVTPARTRRRLTLELDRLTARADRLFRGLGRTQGSVGERYRALFADPQWHYPDSDAGRDQAVADMNRVLDAARARVPALLGPVPPFCLDVTARRLSAAELAAGRGGYRELPTPQKPGAYVVDLKDIARRPSWSLRGAVHHELLPGHMTQMPMEVLADPHPLRRRYAPSYAEAWGMYAEQLAAADGVYKGDPLGELGHSHWLLFRVTRGLADLGIHLDGWSIDQARAQLIAWQGEPGYFAPFEIDLPRIAKEPATRASEAMAWLDLADTAARVPAARRVMFHQAMLRHGRMRTEVYGDWKRLA
ncbi:MULTISPECIES: DUF885 family protein [Sphingomonas]|uniref:DUF885 family protein n=1 Tax=Sphingomonas molluscorum TaxID=418184 RepID=A0ABU8QAR7_9SPHN|nr:DUF885 family protein [Sphingomonas sp. JUb134]MBM7408092.1 uncharacterized protein (DUF885 family) [Sphingomonas sp. JUb134]MBM7408238.1 uncharacterized protein (DUF885 family) [Sphingomonas sp. JUb134]